MTKKMVKDVTLSSVCLIFGVVALLTGGSNIVTLLLEGYMKPFVGLDIFLGQGTEASIVRISLIVTLVMIACPLVVYIAKKRCGRMGIVGWWLAEALIGAILALASLFTIKYCCIPDETNISSILAGNLALTQEIVFMIKVAASIFTAVYTFICFVYMIVGAAYILIGLFGTKVLKRMKSQLEIQIGEGNEHGIKVFEYPTEGTEYEMLSIKTSNKERG